MTFRVQAPSYCHIIMGFARYQTAANSDFSHYLIDLFCQLGSPTKGMIMLTTSESILKLANSNLK